MLSIFRQFTNSNVLYICSIVQFSFGHCIFCPSSIYTIQTLLIICLSIDRHNDLFGFTIFQFEREFKACLERRKQNEPQILNILFPIKTENRYLEYLENTLLFHLSHCRAVYFIRHRKSIIALTYCRAVYFIRHRKSIIALCDLFPKIHVFMVFL
jgi:hypothetical protein